MWVGRGTARMVGCSVEPCCYRIAFTDLKRRSESEEVTMGGRFGRCDWGLVMDPRVDDLDGPDFSPLTENCGNMHVGSTKFEYVCTNTVSVEACALSCRLNPSFLLNRCKQYTRPA